MFEITRALGGISGAVDNFVVQHKNTEPSFKGDFVVDLLIQDAPEVEVPSKLEISEAKGQFRYRVSRLSE